MRVAIVDDSALFRTGLAMLLSEAGLEVVVQAGSGHEFLARIDAVAADVAVIDIRLPPTRTEEGLETAETLRARHPSIGILLLSTYVETPYALRMAEIDSHSVGYLLKDRVDDVEALIDALGRIENHELVLDPEVVTRLLGRRRHREALSQLTGREQEILRLMAEGRSNAGIGERLHLSTRTVENHVTRILPKLGLESSHDDNRRVLAVLAWLRAAEG
jgi:DNA-binding NarL/FixJ family response regulator